uniref:Uncharacterized protein n=1 Tax=Picea glauca TaxID=3330 RepID=A0A101M0F0_PICGL|nr:hypothetical protein ABT39_MTgene4731 [Picea glauca]
MRCVEPLSRSRAGATITLGWTWEGTVFGRRRNGKGTGARYERITLWSFGGEPSGSSYSWGVAC